MNKVFTDFMKSEVVFSMHARQRTLERFKIYLNKYERDDVLIFLKRDFKTAKVNMARMMSHGYTNSRDSKFGKNSFIAKSKYMYYFGNLDEKSNKIIIRTVYPVSSVKRNEYYGY